MHVPELAAVYRTKTDEELVELSKEQDDLTEEARHALSAELAVRRISANPSDDWDSNNERHPERASVDAAATHLPSKEFLEEVLRFYANNRWLFVKMAFPAVFVGTASIIVTRAEGRELQRQLLHNLIQPRVAVYESIVLMWIAYLVSWLMFSMSFASTSVAAEQILSGFEATVRESFEVVLQRVFPLVRASLLLMGLLAGIGGGFIFLSGIAFGAFPGFVHRHPLSIWVGSYTGFAIVALIVSRFSLAIPAVVLDDCKVGQAMFRSDELTKGKWGILAILLFKSIVGGYIAGMLPFWLARLLLSSMPLTPGFSWFLTAASVAAVTIVEPIMFIGFALLYVKTTAVSAPAAMKAGIAG